MNHVFLGIDGGGTHTRVAAADARGRVVGYVDVAGAASIFKDPNARANVHGAIRQVLASVNRSLSDVAGLAAGIAGYNGPSDLEWVCSLTDVDGLDCPIVSVNDAVIAHKGAFFAGPGIIAISGTGSTIFAITDSGEHIRNADFEHYATAARYLAYEAVHKIVAGETDFTDRALIDAAHTHFGDDLTAFFSADSFARRKRFGEFAPHITRAAMGGSHLAMALCDRAASALVTGARLLGARFGMADVPIVLIGSVANCDYIKNSIAELLTQRANRAYHLAESKLPPVLGAVLMAMECANIEVGDQALENLLLGASLVASQPC